MIKEHWPRIAAIDLQTDGSLGAVWLAWDRTADVAHCYDCCVWPMGTENLVVAGGLNARGRWIPIAWFRHASAKVDALEDLGCNILRMGKSQKPLDDNEVNAASMAQVVKTRMLTHRFRVAKHLGEWKHEYSLAQQSGAAVPKDGYPLMIATRCAIAHFDYAKAQGHGTFARKNYAKVPVI